MPAGVSEQLAGTTTCPLSMPGVAPSSKSVDALQCKVPMYSWRFRNIDTMLTYLALAPAFGFTRPLQREEGGASRSISLSSFLACLGPPLNSKESLHKPSTFLLITFNLINYLFYVLGFNI